MCLFLDQMFRVELATALRDAGHDVVRGGEIGMGRAEDADILAEAIAQRRVLVTLDGHFGDWAVLPLREHTGVIRLRINPATTENAMLLLKVLLAGRTEAEFADQLVIVSPSRVRWRRTQK